MSNNVRGATKHYEEKAYMLAALFMGEVLNKGYSVLRPENETPVSTIGLDRSALLRR